MIFGDFAFYPPWATDASYFFSLDVHCGNGVFVSPDNPYQLHTSIPLENKLCCP
jgi:hypothetical protein